MKKYALIVTLLCSNALQASLSSTRIYNNFLVKITNNSSKTFRLHCSNKDWDLILFSSASQLDLFTEKFDKPLPQIQQDYNDLVVQKNARVLALKTDQKTDVQIEQDSQVKALDAKLKVAEEKLRPVIKPRSVADNLPCRIFGPGDIPTTKPKNWQWPETEIKGDTISIKLVDTNAQGNCPAGRIKITAKSGTYETSLCTDNSLYFGKIHLIIEENGTFKLEQIDNPIPQ